MAWIVLFIAGLLDIGWAIGLKFTEGFTRLWPTIGTVASMILSIVLLGLARKTLPVGTAYAIWTESARSATRFSASSCSANPRRRHGSPVSH